MSRLGDFLADVKARCEKARKGPWEAYCIRPGQHPLFGVAEATGERLVICDMSGVDAPEANAELVAHARTDLEVLVAVIKAQDKELELALRGMDVLLSQARENVEAHLPEAGP